VTARETIDTCNTVVNSIVTVTVNWLDRCHWLDWLNRDHRLVLDWLDDLLYWLDSWLYKSVHQAGLISTQVTRSFTDSLDVWVSTFMHPKVTSTVTVSTSGRVDILLHIAIRVDKHLLRLDWHGLNNCLDNWLYNWSAWCNYYLWWSNWYLLDTTTEATCLLAESGDGFVSTLGHPVSTAREFVVTACLVDYLLLGNYRKICWSCGWLRHRLSWHGLGGWRDRHRTTSVEKSVPRFGQARRICFFICR
jgi:hypothetical protein